LAADLRIYCSFELHTLLNSEIGKLLLSLLGILRPAKEALSARLLRRVLVKRVRRQRVQTVKLRVVVVVRLP